MKNILFIRRNLTALLALVLTHGFSADLCAMTHAVEFSGSEAAQEYSDGSTEASEGAPVNDIELPTNSSLWSANIVQVAANDWFQSSWFGWFQKANLDEGWMYHTLHGYLYSTGSSQASDLWFYDYETEDWVFTSAELYPFVYSIDLESWLYYYQNSTQPRWFYSYVYSIFMTDDYYDGNAPYTIDGETYPLELSELGFDYTYSFNDDGTYDASLTVSAYAGDGTLSATGPYTFERTGINSASLSIGLTSLTLQTSLLGQPVEQSLTPDQAANLIGQPVPESIALTLTFHLDGSIGYEGQITMTDDSTVPLSGTIQPQELVP